MKATAAKVTTLLKMVLFAFALLSSYSQVSAKSSKSLELAYVRVQIFFLK